MKKKKKRIGILVLFICIILICMFYSMRYIFLQEDLIFFQMFHSIIKSEKNSNNQKESKEIEFLVEYNHTKLKSLNLMETIHNKTLIYEKIAPGTSGNFNIVLKSKQNMQYMVQFESKNQKPSNLQFSITEKGKKQDSLEKLNEMLRGTILENQEKVMNIYWEWKYEGNREDNAQDTMEAKKIREYHFLIYVQGY